MPQPQAEAAAAIPSITTWTRLEPMTRDASMQRSLQAQVRDPLWFLARQYQMGEFLGDDGGSPLHASALAEYRNITTFRPGRDDSKTQAIDAKVPVEVHVEREAVTLRLRGAVQLGRYFEKLVRQSPAVSQPEQTIASFRKSFPILAQVPDSELASPDALRLRSITAASSISGAMIPGRVVNGIDLYPSALACVNGTVPPKPLPSGCNDPALTQILKDFVAFRQSLFSEPAQDFSWQSTQLDYDFALGSPVADDRLLLVGNDFKGGHLDWYSFSLGQAASTPVSSQNPATVTTQVFDVLPNHVVFRGMPDPRWWNFEDAATDFGQLDPENVDLPKLLVMEFALIYGNDWFSVPIPVPLGNSQNGALGQPALSRIDALVVTDTFGVRTFIKPAEQTTVSPGESVWSMFKISGQNTRSDFIVVAPTLGQVVDATALEEVLLLRDDMAAMAWAVEQKVQGDLDTAVDAYEAFLQSRQGQGEPAPAYTPGGPDIYYRVEGLPPYNWVPMVPVLSNQGSLYLRRGALEIPDLANPSQLVLRKAHALILEPDHPFFVIDHTVPRSGLKVNRYFRFTRSFYGSTFLWSSRKSSVGRGPGWSGLRFDLVRDIPKKQGG